jgi:phosphoesterase RecJ-like protein
MADLVDAGASVGRLNQMLYSQFPLRRVEMLRELLNVMRLSAGSRIASWSLSVEAKQRLRIQGGDSEGLIDILRGIDTVVAAVFFEEMADGTVRISARSKSDTVDVCRACEKFGGGGHRAAAGAGVPGTLAEVEQQFLTVLQDEITGTGH